MAAGKKAVDILYSVPNLNVQKLAYKKWNVSQNVLQTNTNGDFILRQVLRPKFWHPPWTNLRKVKFTCVAKKWPHTSPRLLDFCMNLGLLKPWPCYQNNRKSISWFHWFNNVLLPLWQVREMIKGLGTRQAWFKLTKLKFETLHWKHCFVFTFSKTDGHQAGREGDRPVRHILIWSNCSWSGVWPFLGSN